MATILLVSVLVIGWAAAAVLGTQAYFRGEMTKPIHERNWNSEPFTAIAQSVTGQSLDEVDRVPGFEVGDAYGSASLGNAQ
jgi:hypothetical protein